jgi:hypothetical protein
MSSSAKAIAGMARAPEFAAERSIMMGELHPASRMARAAQPLADAIRDNFLILCLPWASSPFGLSGLTYSFIPVRFSRVC